MPLAVCVGVFCVNCVQLRWKLSHSGDNWFGRQVSGGDDLGYLGSLIGTAGNIYSGLPPLRRWKNTFQFCLNGMQFRQQYESLQRLFETPELMRFYSCIRLFSRNLSVLMS